jgi:ABC-type uncharacterized transport system involved in gliding motility auxiliary subunit
LVVVSDGDVAANGIRDAEKEIYMPLGLNRYENRLYANQDFLVNAIEYLTDSDGIIAARSKEVKLRMLDTVRAKDEKDYWRFFNIGLPLLVLGAFAFAFNRIRKKRFAA